jgi:AAA15 family ATPase/GTPase
MLQNIQIQNFRCFEDFKAEGFERINLIGGKNNSGKTCLLEAIGTFSGNYSFVELISLRGQQSLEYRNIKFPSSEVKISINDTKDFSLQVFSDNDDYPKNAHLEIFLILQNSELPKLNILASFDKFDEKLIKHRLIDILKSIDNRIEDVRTFKSKDGLWIKKNDEKYQPINFYGDAIRNVLRYFTPIFEKSLHPNRKIFSTYLLIDEIENGIHYTAQYDFWKNIFKLSKELNVQIFATTHSLEMIQQFNKVAKEEGEGAYFEMSREFETGQIFAQKHDTELLEYELEKTTSTIRG